MTNVYLKERMAGHITNKILYRQRSKVFKKISNSELYNRSEQESNLMTFRITAELEYSRELDHRSQFPYCY